MKVVLSFLLLMFSGINFSFSQGGQDRFEVFGDFIVPSFCLTMLNDVNPLLNQKSNDFGHTLGVLMDYCWRDIEKQRYYEGSFETNLYTKNVAESYFYNNEGRKIYPQFFTEISSVNFEITQYLEHRKFFLGLKAYVGVYNRSKPINGLALYMQGGKDGNGGYHEFMSNQPGVKNIGTGAIEPLFYLEPSIKKLYRNFGSIFTGNQFAFVRSGVKFGYPFEGCQFFSNTDLELPLLRVKSRKVNIIKLTLLYLHEISLHQKGVLYTPEVGAELSLFCLCIGYTSNFYLGRRNTSFYNYLDDEKMMRVYIKFRRALARK